MKIQISKAALTKALETVAPIAAKKTALPILANAKCVVRGSVIRFHAFDTENAIRSYAPLEAADADGEFLVSTADLLRYARSLPSDAVEIDIADATATVRAGRSKAVFPVCSAAEYPDTWDDTDTIAEFPASAEFMADMTADGRAFVGSDDFHPQLMCVHIYVAEGEAGYAATDSRKLVANSYLSSAQGQATALVHKSMLPMLLPDACTIVFKAKHTIFDYGTTKICAALPQGKFPDFRRILPATAAASVELPTADLRSVVRRLLTIAASATPCAVFRFSMGGIDISASDINTGRSATDYLDCPTSAEFSVAFSLPYLSDVLGRISAPSFTLSYVGEGRAVLFTDPAQPRRSCILMPMAMPDQQ